MNRIFLSPPHLGTDEQRLVEETFAANYVGPVGEMLGSFEAAVCEYTGFKYAVAVASGTAAMHLALRHLGVGAGDVVLASTLTFIGSVSPATFAGAEIVFVDAEASSWNMDPELLRGELESLAAQGVKPKAVIPTDLYGQCCNLPEILSVCDAFGVPVICDSAEALGARFRRSGIGGTGDAGIGECWNAGIGGLGDAGMLELGNNAEGCGNWVHAGRGAKAAVFSFNGNKIITCGGGGMLVSDDAEMIAHARKLATQSRDPAPWYEHTEIGYNYRLSNLLAAVGVGQMQVLDERVAKRRQIFEWYREFLDDVEEIFFVPEPEWSRGNRWLTVVQIEPKGGGPEPLAVIERLEQENIEARPVWKPMHLQPVFSDCKMAGGPVSERLFTCGLCLPSGTALEEVDVERVAAVVRSCF
jgi:dTDP-4-amino-4,6-dideoxygalactose transaminase